MPCASGTINASKSTPGPEHHNRPLRPRTRSEPTIYVSGSNGQDWNGKGCTWNGGSSNGLGSYLYGGSNELAWYCLANGSAWNGSNDLGRSCVPSYISSNGLVWNGVPWNGVPGMVQPGVG